MAYIPQRGDIIWTDFDPSAGHEQANKRLALVLSIEAFNHQVKLALVAPITSRIRGHGFEVKLVDIKTQGVVLCQQVKTIDYVSRGADFIEQLPQTILNEVLAKVRAIVH